MSRTAADAPWDAPTHSPEPPEPDEQPQQQQRPREPAGPAFQSAGERRTLEAENTRLRAQLRRLEGQLEEAREELSLLQDVPTDAPVTRETFFFVGNEHTIPMLINADDPRQRYRAGPFTNMKSHRTFDDPISALRSDAYGRASSGGGARVLQIEAVYRVIGVFDPLKAVKPVSEADLVGEADAEHTTH